MSINAVSDVFAFACNHPDYWDLLRSDDDIPELGTEERKEAFVAAREHVLDSVEALLRTSLAAFQARVPEDDARYHYLRRKRIQSRATREKCFVYSLLLEGRGKQAWLNISLEPDWEGKKIRLYANIQSNLENIAAFQTKCPANPPATVADGNFYYFGDIEINEGDGFPVLAERLAAVAWPGIAQFVELVSPSAKA